ncbi:mitogen-activated protein kinase kinase kinase 14 [Gouania willdenowi]|uniref:Mitogen-activated protein kinase kinase kinase 14-like n=1 Tax=Gouania willdenowi TaxID=441366 RepID=A0A8C5GSF8_GOUWI|nr:mitogen-activated protein kinase kinase kinase 14-like [Gouania willdenowi]
MAIPRMFNSNTPFIIVTGESELSVLGKDDDGVGVAGRDEEEKEEERNDSVVQAMAPHLSRAMQHGTAKRVCDTTCEEELFISIVAQAESEEFQEFTPSHTHRNFAPSQLTTGTVRSLRDDIPVLSDSEEDEKLLVQRKQQRKQSRKSVHSVPQEVEHHRPVIRGLWVQEVDWLGSEDGIIPPPPQFTDRPQSVSGSEESDDSSVSVPLATFDLMHVSGFTSSLEDWDSESTEGTSDSKPEFGLNHEDDGVPDELRGKVTQIPKIFVPPDFRDLIRTILNGWKTSKPANEGLIFHHKLQPRGCEYREGEEYNILHHIQNGSYGDVFSVRDTSTGFKCAAKRIALNAFSSEEVSTWSALNSPRVVELFGVVREGVNVVLFMDLKPACLGQLLRDMSSLPEDLALHYLHQTLGALEHLHDRRVIHLDVKVDNVLLSADLRDSFLCDFGLSQTLQESGRSNKTFIRGALPGTESHMSPEVAAGAALSAKVDVWSSCCMLLHMLNGRQPWTRYYSHPLCLTIVNEPPPLWEVPSTCNHFTANVFRAGLKKDPQRRASAAQLRRKTVKACRAVGGLSLQSIKSACENLRRTQSLSRENPKSSSREVGTRAGPAALGPTMCWVSPWRTRAKDEDRVDSDQDQDQDHLTSEWDQNYEPTSLREENACEEEDEEDWESGSDSEVDIYMGEEELTQENQVRAEQDYEGDWEEEEEEEEEEWESSQSTDYLRALRGVFPLLQKTQTDKNSWGSKAELEFIRDDVPVGSTFQTLSPEPRDEPPSCFSCSDTSERDSDHSSDDLSSGVFSSSNSHIDGNLEWLESTNQPPSRCLEGVDLWIEKPQGECLRIRERRLVKVGHVAIGISDQVSGKSFTLETLDRKTLSFEEEIKQSGLWLRCVPAPDQCQRWRWRVRDGKLELRE